MGLPIVESLSGLQESIFSLFRGTQLNYHQKCENTYLNLREIALRIELHGRCHSVNCFAKVLRALSAVGPKNLRRGSSAVEHAAGDEVPGLPVDVRHGSFMPERVCLHSFKWAHSIWVI